MINNIVLVYLEGNKINDVDYIFLSQIRERCSEMVLICNNKIDATCRTELERYSNYIIVNHFASINEGFKIAFEELKRKIDLFVEKDIVLVDLSFVATFINNDIFFSNLNDNQNDIIVVQNNYCSENVEVSHYNFIILKNKVVNDYAFDRYLNSNKLSCVDIFFDSGFSIDYYIPDESIMIKTTFSDLDIKSYDVEKCQSFMAIIDKLDDRNKEIFIKRMIADSSSSTLRNLFKLNYIIDTSININDKKDFSVLCFIETEPMIDYINAFIDRTENSYKYYIFVREENYINKITKSKDVLNVDLFYRECTGEKILSCIEECNTELVGILFENGNQDNMIDNISNSIINDEFVSSLFNIFKGNKYLGVVIPQKYIGDGRFIRNDVYNKQLINNSEYFSENLINDFPECCIVSKTNILKACLNIIMESAEEDEINKDIFDDFDFIRIIPFALKKMGYLTGRSLNNNNKDRYMSQLIDIVEDSINTSVRYGDIESYFYNDYKNECKKLFSGYYTLYSRVQKLNKENKKLSDATRMTVVEKVEIPVEIGLKQAAKNFLKHRLGN